MTGPGLFLSAVAVAAAPSCLAWPVPKTGNEASLCVSCKEEGGRRWYPMG